VSLAQLKVGAVSPREAGLPTLKLRAVEPRNDTCSKDIGKKAPVPRSVGAALSTRPKAIKPAGCRSDQTRVPYVSSAAIPNSQLSLGHCHFVCIGIRKVRETVNTNKLFELYSKYLWPMVRLVVRTSRRCQRCILSEKYVPLRRVFPIDSDEVRRGI
jgi:hypothetical protein